MKKDLKKQNKLTETKSKKVHGSTGIARIGAIWLECQYCGEYIEKNINRAKVTCFDCRRRQIRENHYKI
jgi:hypothetical protein